MYDRFGTGPMVICPVKVITLSGDGDGDGDVRGVKRPGMINSRRSLVDGLFSLIFDNAVLQLGQGLWVWTLWYRERKWSEHRLIIPQPISGRAELKL